ncbi:MAG: hypothetical protein R3D68_12265 [Hyphomicrobiaceae bacterium]
MSIERISVGQGGEQNGTSSRSSVGPSISADGRFIVYESYSDYLLPTDTSAGANSYLEVYLFDRSTGTTSRISTTSDGTRGNGASFDPTITPDGRYVVMKSQASNITGASETHIIRKDLLTGEVVIAGVAYPDDNANGEPSISDDGRYLGYLSPTFLNVRYDIQTGESLVANSFPDGTVATGINSSNIKLSPDGRYAVFYSDVQFAPGDTGAFFPGSVPSYDIFLKDFETGSIERISNSYVNPGQYPNRDSNGAVFSGNGRYIVYLTNATDIAPGDTNQFGDIIRYDRLTGVSELVSTTSTGEAATGPGYGSITPQISYDGRFVVFESSATNLRPNDTNGVQEIFVKDMVTGAVKPLSIADDGTQANHNSSAPSISADGRYVIFTSQASNLGPENPNYSREIFLVDLAESGFWQGVELTGAPIQVNTQSQGNQYNPAGVATLPDGRFIVVWNDTYEQQVKAQIFDASGAKVGSEYVILAGSSSGYDPGMITLADGRIVVYSGTSPDFGVILGLDGQPEASIAKQASASGYYYSTALTGGGFVIAASVDGYVNIGIQAYDANGNMAGPQFKVPSGTFNEFVTKDIVALGNGGYGLLYDQVSTGLLLQRFDASGSAVGTTTRISNSTADINYHSMIDAVTLPDGRALVAWAQGGSIHARFLANDGTMDGAEFTVAASGGWPKLTLTSEGRIAVAWSAGSSLLAQVLEPDGTPVAPAATMTTSLRLGWTYFASALPNGGVIYSWRGQDSSGEGAEARIIGKDGNVISDELLLNPNETGHQFGEFAAANSQGTILALYSDGSGADGSGWGLFARTLSITGFEASPPANRAPTDITLSSATVTTGAAVGTIVGTLGAVDADTGDTHTFTLVDDPSGYFEVAGDHVRVRPGVTFDAGSAGNYDILVRVTDASGASYEETLTLSVLHTIGDAGNDTLQGSTGDDVLAGHGGSDTLTGGAGADDFVRNGNDPAGQSDTVTDFDIASGDRIVLGPEGPASLIALSRIWGFGGGDFQLTGLWNGQTQTLTLTGVTSGELLAVNKSYASPNFVFDTSATPRDITGTANADHLFGGRGNDTLRGEGGDDILFGDVGADHMIGGAGGDTYYVDDIGDTIEEVTGQGYDTVITNTTYALGAGVSVELLRTWGSASTQDLDLTGNELNNTIVGNSGANVIDGRGGDDSMWGYGGDDTYLVDSTGDTVIEAVGGGNDTIMTTISYALANAAEIETLRVHDAGSSDAINLTGNAFANRLEGNAGANALDGRSGADVMRGYGGNDIYYVDNFNDAIIEVAGEGYDTVITDTTYALGAGVSVELLRTWGTATTQDLDLTGNELSNTIVGNSGVNVLTGGGGDDLLWASGGDDTLIGGAGHDTLHGGGGADTFAFVDLADGFDTIQDFVSGEDRIALSSAAFGLDAGALAGGVFSAGDGLMATLGSSPALYFDSTGGRLYFDQTGGTTSDAVVIAQLTTGTLTEADIIVI